MCALSSAQEVQLEIYLDHASDLFTRSLTGGSSSDDCALRTAAGSVGNLWKERLYRRASKF